MTWQFHYWLYIWKKIKTPIQKAMLKKKKKKLCSSVHSSIVYNCEDMEATYMSINR